MNTFRYALTDDLSNLSSVKNLIDPKTLMPVSLNDHRFLEVSRFSCKLKSEIHEWLEDNFESWSFGFDCDHGEYCLWFSDEKDITMFLLRWS